jgi:hypothetical protein
MNYIECPNEYKKENDKLKLSVFLAGGISNCYNWQNNAIQYLKDEDITIINPRRKHFDKLIPNIEKEQIEWEHRHLKLADIIMFWFPSETVCPITLYELGTWSSKDKPIFIGVDEKYERLLDLKIQTKLARPEVKIVHSLEDLCNQIKQYIQEIK